jgi:hypothetical protein
MQKESELRAQMAKELEDLRRWTENHYNERLEKKVHQAGMSDQGEGDP